LTDDQKRRAAMEKMFEEQKAKKDLISRALAEQQNGERINHTAFDNDEDDIKVDDAFNMDVDEDEGETKTPIEAKKWMFDSDEDESDEELGTIQIKLHEENLARTSISDLFFFVDIKINPVLEGEAGRKRLELQKKFKGDDRFKLGEDFIDEEEEKKRKKDLGDEITQELGAEKHQAMDVLRAMFGDQKVEKTKVSTRNTTWSNAARFDPDADDSSKYLAEKPTDDNTSDQQAKEDNDEREEDDDEDDLSKMIRKPESAIPVVSTEKHFEVNANLKPLFGDASAPFTLFGGDDDDTPIQESKSLFGKSENNYETNFTPKKAEGRLGLGVLFFFHLDEPSLMNK
jgi:hypothetical protein